MKNSLITITGTLTSSPLLRGENTPEPYYYAFIRLKGQNIDLPVIFKTEPNLKKGTALAITGHYSNSEKSIRKSFTVHSWSVLNSDFLAKEQLVKSTFQLAKLTNQAETIIRSRKALTNA
jgi:hypothetical protein